MLSPSLTFCCGPHPQILALQNYGGILHGLGRGLEAERYILDMYHMAVRLWGDINPFHVEMRSSIMWIKKVFSQDPKHQRAIEVGGVVVTGVVVL